MADVGQSQREEIDLVEKGKNYGWNIMDGSLTYSAGNQEGLEAPIWEYSHEEGIAVIGGYVYRGSILQGLFAKYIYGDYGSGKVWALQHDDIASPLNTLLANTDLSISSFGIDEANELYFCALNGKIYALVANDIPEFPSTTIVLALLIAAILLIASIYRNHFKLSSFVQRSH